MFKKEEDRFLLTCNIIDSRGGHELALPIIRPLV